MATFKDYYSLTKPGVLYGNAITAVAGYLLASRWHIMWPAFVAITVGSTFVIASACVINNVLDVDIDSKMSRTKTRAIVAGKVKPFNAVILSAVLGLAGMAILIVWTNWLVVIAGLVGFVTYVVLYGMLSKRLSIHGTLVGSVSGAVPVLAGYLAARGHIDMGAVLVFAALFLWQMPEFYSIAIYRRSEYKAAGVPVISVVKGKEVTRTQILYYTIAFVISTLLLTVYGYAGVTYFVVMALLGGRWLWIAAKGFSAKDIDTWARQMFKFSLIILLAYSAMIAITPILP